MDILIQSKLQKIRELLHAFTTNSLSADDALRSWPDGGENHITEASDAAYHLLQHYSSDGDIHARDKDYKSMQRDQIVGLLQDIQRELHPFQGEQKS